ncbi:MAG TPA: hydrogenase maturation protease [Candidatus Limnocylindrales bacterium]|nr:hydrogenase maturation protease [Candidatus Limnocylindrales bacterium]
MRDVLVIGYGNALRTDDGLGWHAAERLAADPRLAGATVLQRHQLTPELALDISRAAFVVFVDASRGPAGALSVEPVEAATDATLSWSHHVDPSVLIALSRDLYSRAPDAVAVSVGVASDAAGDRLSPVVEAALPDVAATVARLVAERGGAVPATAAIVEPASTTAEHGRA